MGSCALGDEFDGEDLIALDAEGRCLVSKHKLEGVSCSILLVFPDFGQRNSRVLRCYLFVTGTYASYLFILMSLFFQTSSVLVVFNVYCPRADALLPERQIYKLKFYRLLELRARAFVAQGDSVIIMGDINTSHKKIDHCEPEKVNNQLITIQFRSAMDFLTLLYIVLQTRFILGCRF